MVAMFWASGLSKRARRGKCRGEEKKLRRDPFIETIFGINRVIFWEKSGSILAEGRATR